MASPPVRLVALDLDGTTVRSDGTVSARTIAAVAAAVDAGVAVTIATGRPPRFSERTADELGIGAEIVCANGAVTFHVAERRLTRSVPIGADLNGLVERIRVALPGVSFAAEWDLEYAVEEAFAASLPEQPEHAPTVADVLDLAHHPIYKLLAVHDDLDAPALTEIVLGVAGDIVEPSHSGLGFVEIAPQGVTKASGVAHLADRLGIGRAEVLAVGDAYNDLPLLTWAGRSLAMPHASEEVRAAADGTAPAGNDDDGVAVVLEELAAQASTSATSATSG